MLRILPGGGGKDSGESHGRMRDPCAPKRAMLGDRAAYLANQERSVSQSSESPRSSADYNLRILWPLARWIEDKLGAKMRCDKCGKRPERYYAANQSDTPGFVRSL